MKYLWFSLILSLSSLNEVTWGRHRSISNECPAPEDIPKCRCCAPIGGLSITCSGFPTNVELQDLLFPFRGYSVQKLTISHYNATTIDTDVWKGLEIKRLVLTNVNVQDASFRRGKKHFQGLERSLESLEIDKSFKIGQRALVNLQLGHMEKLKDIIFERNGIPEVGNDWFASGPKQLRVLIFESNNIEELGDKAFNSLSNLGMLVVAGNHIRTISRSMFPQSADKLVTLDLASNNIRTLPDDMFTGMTSLHDLNLEQNLIHVIKEDIWKPISSELTKLNLKVNPLQCDGNMKWICGTNLKNAEGQCSAPAEMRNKKLQQFCEKGQLVF